MYTYAFYIHLNNLALNTIKASYEIEKEEFLVIIIDDEKYTGFKSTKELMEIIY